MLIATLLLGLVSEPISNEEAYRRDLAPTDHCSPLFWVAEGLTPFQVSRRQEGPLDRFVGGQMTYGTRLAGYNAFVTYMFRDDRLHRLVYHVGTSAVSLEQREFEFEYTAAYLFEVFGPPTDMGPGWFRFQDENRADVLITISADEGDDRVFVRVYYDTARTRNPDFVESKCRTERPVDIRAGQWRLQAYLASAQGGG